MVLRDLFGVDKPLIGMVHLQPLPGSPRYAGDFDWVVEQAQAEARALVAGGMDGLLFENYHDVPFCKERVGPETVAAMAVVVREVGRAVSRPYGVNVLRNDALAALAVAAVGGAQFIRVNVHLGAMLTDQGLVEGRAYETLRYRQGLAPGVKIFADVLVKHALPLGSPTLAQAARDAAYRGLADALIVSGPRTGEPCDPSDLVQVRAAVPEVPLLVGSGVRVDNVATLLALADGAIVGTSLKEEGDVNRPVDERRVRELVQAARTRSGKGLGDEARR
ncbi:MAG TPA: BtpA/SgcQ family protein [Armatimonadetes bacterium]|nr:BtpA/SgcQ family protein [Armatimonadota bacterium]